MRFVVTIGVAVIVYVLSHRLLRRLRRTLMARAKSREQRSSVEVFFRILQYGLIGLLAIFALLFYFGSLPSIGITTGLFTAALGWALQRPITGIAAWLLVVTKRPFVIGDWIVVGNVRGEVVDITLTHIHIGEIGGTVAAEERSGRTILVPNAKIFEENIINYTKDEGDDVRDEVRFSVTYESDTEKAKAIAKEVAEGVLDDFPSVAGREAALRVWFQPSGIDVVVRYDAPTAEREEIKSRITEGILARVRDTEGVTFAYPHQEVILRKQDNF